MNDVESRGISGDSGLGCDGGLHRSHVRFRDGVFRVLRISREREESHRRENRQNRYHDDEFGKGETL